MTSQVQDFTPGRRPMVIRPVIEGGSTSITLAGSFTATSVVISAEIEDDLSVAELAAAAVGEAEIASGDYVTLDELESAADE